MLRMYRPVSEETGKKVAFIKWVRCSTKIVGPFGNTMPCSVIVINLQLTLVVGCVTSSRTVLKLGSLSRVHVNH